MTQLSFQAEGLDPRQLAEIPILERAKLYTELGLDPPRREAIEDAVRLFIRRRYGVGR